MKITKKEFHSFIDRYKDILYFWNSKRWVKISHEKLIEFIKESKINGPCAKNMIFKKFNDRKEQIDFEINLRNNPYGPTHWVAIKCKDMEIVDRKMKLKKVLK